MQRHWQHRPYQDHQSRLCLFDSGEGQSFKEYMAGGIKHRFGII